MDVVLHEGPPEALLAEWGDLYAAHPQVTPFMSPGWAAAWWSHYGGDGVRARLVCVREAGRLVALAPLVVRRRGPLRIMEPLGMEPGDYWDVLCLPGTCDAALAVIAEALRERVRGWDAWILRCPPPGSAVVAALDAAGLRSLARPPILAPAIELPASFDEYLAGLAGSHRQNLRRHLRRLDSGEVVLREVTDVEELPAVLQRWQSFRRRQWEAAGRAIDPDHLSPRFAGFMLDCLRRLVPSGTGLVWEFARDGTVVGTYVNFADADAFHWYLGGFDPAATSLGLGKIAIGHGIRTSIAAGRRRYDFGRGAEPYKYWYGAIDRPLVVRVVAGPGPLAPAVLTGARLALRWRSRSTPSP